MDKLTVFLVDDHAVVRLGLRTLLEDLPWIEIVGEAGTAAEAIAGVAAQQPNAVLMDIRLPDDSGIIACKTITSRWPQIHVIMLTSYSDDTLIVQAEQAGACCYILKQVGNQVLVEALEYMRDDDLSLDSITRRDEIEQQHAQLMSQQGGRFKKLTAREIQVLLEVTDGKTNSQIAAALSMSEQSVCNDMNIIIEKLGVDNRFEAAILALRYRRQLIVPERSDEIFRA